MNIKDILVEAIDRTGKSDTAVVGWGRGMGHKGHMYLASSVITQANEMNADPYFVVSRTVGKDDPITPEEKLEIYRKVFPEHGHIFQTASDEMPDLTRVLRNLNQQGYRNAVVVVGADQVKALSYVKNYNGIPDKSGEVPFKFDSLEVISRQQTNDPSKELEGPRATPMREILMNPNASDEQKFAVWRDAMPDALSDKEVLVLMQKAQQRMGEFKPATKKAKVKEFIQRVRPMLKEANTAQKLKALKLIKEALTEFDAGEGGFGPFKLYAGDAHKYHHVDTFNSLDAAIEEVEFLIDSRPELVTTYWKIVDGTGEQVWDQDPDTMYDKMRSAGKMQFKKPDNKGVAEGASDLKKKISKYEELALAANRAGDDEKCKLYQRKIQSLKQKMSQGVAEGSEDLDKQALDVADKLTTDKNLAKLNDMAHDSTIYRALERYFAKNNISTTIFNRVAAIVFKKLDKYGRRLSTDPRIQEQGVAEATGDPKFDTMMSRMAAEPKVADMHSNMPPTSIPELLQWANKNDKPYHRKFAEWARNHNFTNVNAALEWFGDNVDPWDEFGSKEYENVFGDLVGEPLIDAAKHDPKAAELLKVYVSYEKIFDDWTDKYRQMNYPDRFGNFNEQGMAEATGDIASAKERLAYLEKIFDTSYEYSDDHSVWKRHNEIRQEMDRLKKIIGQDVTEDSDNPFELQKKHPMNHGMKKFMIRQIVKHTEYGTSELSLASDEELTQLFNEVVPNAQEVTKRFVGFLSEKLAEEKESRLYKQHQKIRKEKGLPDPSHYKKMAQQKQKEIDALNAEIAADKSKDDYLEEN